MSEDNKAILEIRELNKRFGGLQAVSNFSLSLKKGELKGLIGPNGAGKTTIFNLISGLLKSDSGRVSFKGVDITNKSPDRIVKQGIGRTFQKVRMGKSLTVLDEVKIAFFTRMTYNFFDAIFQTAKYRAEEKKIEDEAYEILDFLGVADLSDKLAEDISHGLQMKVSIARALAMKPEALLLDEPASGLNPNETKGLIDLISGMKEKFNLTILLIEHDMSVIMNICQDIIAINEGSIIGMGTPEEIQKNKRVVDAYLGGA